MDNLLQKLTSVNFWIIIFTCLVSIPAFYNRNLITDLIFAPVALRNKTQWYRFITCGFIHANWMHLVFNMYSLYIFGDVVALAFSHETVFGANGKLLYFAFYLLALIASIVPTYLKEKNNNNYASLGASGAVSAVVFSAIFLYPTLTMELVFLPIPLPAFLFGLIYVGISIYLNKRGSSVINHSAHLWGGLFGVIFTIVACLFFSDFNPLKNFTGSILNYFLHLFA